MAETENQKSLPKTGEHKHGPISRNGSPFYGVVFLPSIAHDFIACKQERLQRLQHINQMVYLGSMEILCAKKRGGLLENQGLDSLFFIVVWRMEFQDSLDPLPSLERSEAYSPENIETKSVA